jgi:ABC-type Fe3+ transport system permease subunit
MKAAICLTFLICLSCLVLIAKQLHRAPEGFEDEKGFHYGVPEYRGRNLFAAQLFWIWSLVTLSPLVGIFFGESLLLLTRLESSWATPIHSALRHSVFWHLGFWEWTGAVAVFLFLCAAVFLTPRRATLPYVDSVQLRCDSRLR